MLPYLYKRIIEFGGKIQQKFIKSFDESSMFDLVINCTGLGAQELIKDTEMKPIRGQVMRVKAPWLYHVVQSDDNYIIPK